MLSSWNVRNVRSKRRITAIVDLFLLRFDTPTQVQAKTIIESFSFYEDSPEFLK